MQVVPNAVAVRATIKPAVIGKSTREVVVEVAPLGYSPEADDYSSLGEWVKPVTVELPSEFATFDHKAKKRDVVDISQGTVTLGVKTGRGFSSLGNVIAEYNGIEYLSELLNLLIVRGGFVSSKNWLLPQLEGALKNYSDSRPIDDHKLIELALV